MVTLNISVYGNQVLLILIKLNILSHICLNYIQIYYLSNITTQYLFCLNPIPQVLQVPSL